MEGRGFTDICTKGSMYLIGVVNTLFTQINNAEGMGNKKCNLFIVIVPYFQVQNIKFNSEIADVSANRRLVVMAFKEKLAAFDACNLEAR